MLADRLLALLGSLAVVAVIFTTEVTTNYYLFQSDFLTTALGLIYAGGLAYLALFPRQVVMHQILPIAGLIFWSGRAAAFLELALEGHTNLWGAFLERIYLAGLLMMWHYWSTHQLSLAKTSLAV